MKLLLDDKTTRGYDLNANEACIFAAILKCTRAGRGWYGNYRELAAAMPFVMSHETARRAVQKLLNLGLIERREEKLFAVAQIVTDDAQNVTVPTQNVSSNAQNVSSNAQNVLPPNNPLNINNKNEMENENTRTCVHAHDTATPTIPGFFDIRKEFSRAGGGGMTTHMEMQANEEWNKCTPAKKVKLLEAVKAGAHFKPRLDWLIADFPEPTPTNWSGTAIGGEMLAVHSAEIACYDGKFGVYSNEDIVLFNLKKAQQ